jgi:dTDP-4-amino-4,6-dideoxygalactose transaminase
MTGLAVPHFGLKRQYNNLKDELLAITDDVLKSGQFLNGKYTRQLENWLAHRCRAQYAIVVGSGTQALEIIARFKYEQHYQNINLNPSKPKIRIPNITYPATLNAFLNAGWDVKLSDTDKYGILKFEKDTGGTYECLVGLYGMHPWDWARIENSYSVIVDGAQHWLECHGQVGSGMAISFDPTKNLNASGNGGAIVTNDAHLYIYAQKYKDNFKPYFEEPGTNTKLSEIDCSHLLVRSKYITEWQERRKNISQYYIQRFHDLPINCLSDNVAPHAHQKFVIYTSDRNSLNTHMQLNNIETKIHYEYVLGDLPVAKELEKPDMLSTSVMLSRGVLSLPMYPELTDNEVEYITQKVIDFFD